MLNTGLTMNRLSLLLLPVLMSSCAMQEGSGAAMGERAGHVARKGARETKNFFGGLVRGWKSEGQPVQAPQQQPYSYPQQPYNQQPQGSTVYRAY
jgi:hypothetical protein